MIKTLKFLTLHIFLLFTFHSYGQGNIDPLVKEANQAFKDGAYGKAKGLYSELLALEPNDPNFNYRLGACMLMSEASKQPAMKYLEYACGEYNVDEEAYFYYGLGFHYTYNFSQAIKWYERFKKSASNKKVAIFTVDQNIEMARNGLGLLKTFSQPVVKKAYQASDNNFYKSYKIDKSIHGLATVPSDLKSKIDLKKKYEGIMMVHKMLNIIFYTSYGEIGETGIDIYSAQINEDGEIGVPTKLPESVNTSYDDGFPFLSTDGKTFYFASKGHNSMGGFDLFKATTTDGVGFSNVENLDYSINSPSDEFLMAENLKEDLKIFSSDRTTDKGRVSVYEVGFSIPTVSYTFISGKFWAANTKSAQVKIELDQNEVDALYTNKSTGEYFLKIPVDNTYVFVVEHTGDSDAYEGNVTVPEEIKGRIVRQEIEVIEEESGNRLEIRNFFEDDLKDDGRGMFAQYLTDNQDLEDQIGVDELASIDMVLDLLKQYNGQIEENLGNYYDGLGTLSQLVKDKQAVTEQDKLLLEQNPDDENLTKDYEKHAYELTALTEMYDLLNAELNTTKEQFAVAQKLTPPVQEAATKGSKEINAAWSKYKEEVGYIERSEAIYLALVKLKELQASKRELVKAAEASGNEYYDDIAAIEKDIRYYKNQAGQTKDKQLKATFEDEVEYLEEELVTTQNAYHNKLKETAELEKEASFYKAVVSAGEQMVDDIQVQSYDVFDTDQIAVLNAEASQETISNFYQYSSGANDNSIGEATGDVAVSNFWTLTTLGKQMDVYLASEESGSESRSKQKRAIEQTLNYYLDNPSDLDEGELSSLEEMKASWRTYQESTQYVQDDIEYLNSLLADENSKVSKEAEIESVFASIYSAEKLTKQQKDQLKTAEEEWSDFQEIGVAPQDNLSSLNDFYFGIEDYKKSLDGTDEEAIHSQRIDIEKELDKLSGQDIDQAQLDSLSTYWNKVKFSDDAVKAELLFLQGVLASDGLSESTKSNVESEFSELEANMTSKQLNSEEYLNLKNNLERGVMASVDEGELGEIMEAYSSALSENEINEIHAQRNKLSGFYDNPSFLEEVAEEDRDSVTVHLTETLFSNQGIEKELEYINTWVEENELNTQDIDSLSRALLYLKDNAVDDVNESLFEETNSKLLALAGATPLSNEEINTLETINDYHFQIDSIYRADLKQNEKSKALESILADIESNQSTWQTLSSDKIEQEEALLLAAATAVKVIVENQDLESVYANTTPEVKTMIDSLSASLKESRQEETRVQVLTEIDNQLVGERTWNESDLLALMVFNKIVETSLDEAQLPDTQSELEFVELDQVEEEIALKINNSQVRPDDVDSYYQALLINAEQNDSLDYTLLSEAFDQLSDSDKEELIRTWSDKAQLTEIAEAVIVSTVIDLDFNYQEQDEAQQSTLQADYNLFDENYNLLTAELDSIQGAPTTSVDKKVLSHLLQNQLQDKREEVVAVRVSWPSDAALSSIKVAESNSEAEQINSIIDAVEKAKQSNSLANVEEAQIDNWKTELSTFKNDAELASDQMIASVYLAELELNRVESPLAEGASLEVDDFKSRINEIQQESPNPQSASDYRTLEVSYMALLDEIDMALENTSSSESEDLSQLKREVEKQLLSVREKLDELEGTEFVQQETPVNSTYSDEQVEMILSVPTGLSAINSLLENNEWTAKELDSLYAERLLILNAKKKEVEQALLGYDGIYTSDLESLNNMLAEQIAAGNPYAEPVLPLQEALTSEVVENGQFISSEDLVGNWTENQEVETIVVTNTQQEIDRELKVQESYVASVDSINLILSNTKKKKVKRALEAELLLLEDSLEVQSVKVEEMEKNKKAMEMWPAIIWKKPLDNDLQEQAKNDFEAAEKEYFRWSDSVENTQLTLDQTKKKKTRKLLETQLAEYQKERRKAAVIYEGKRALKEELAANYDDLLKESSPYGDTLLFTLPEYTFVLSEEEQLAIGMDPVYLMRKDNFTFAQANEHQINLLQTEIDSLDDALKVYESEYNLLVARSETQGGLSENDQAKMLELLENWELALKERQMKFTQKEALRNEQFYLLNQSDEALLYIDDSIKVSHIIAMENMERVGVTQPKDTEEEVTQLVEDQFVINEEAQSGPVEVKEVNLSGLIFKVQIGAFRNAIDESTFDVFNPVTKEFVDNTWTKYFAGMFKAEQTATMARDNIRTFGYADAFVVAYYNGKRISIQRAREIAAGNTAALQGLPLATAPSNTDNTNQLASSVTVDRSEVKERGKVFLTVQVGVYGGSVVPDVLEVFESLNSERMDNGWIRYSSGVYTDIESARAAKQAAVDKGIIDAFITGYFNGERISVDETLRLLQEQENTTVEEAVVEETIETENTIEDLSNASQGTPGSGNYSVRLGPYEDGVPTAAANEILKFGSIGVKRKVQFGKTSYLIGNFDNFEDAEKLQKLLISKALNNPTIIENKEQ